MSVTIDLSPEEERYLQQEAARRRLTSEAYVYRLIQLALRLSESEDASRDEAGDTSRFAAGLEEARRRIRIAIQTEPAFSERASAPLSDDTREDEVLESARARKFSDEAFEQLYGKELAKTLKQESRV